MTVSHRGADASAASSHMTKSEKVARLACCCKLSELLPLVRQMHQRAAQANASRQEQQAA